MPRRKERPGFWMKWSKATLIPRKIAKIYAAYVTALPILWGILFPMGFFTGIAFLWFDSGVLWPLADPSLFLGKSWHDSWLNSFWWDVPPSSSSALFVLEAAFFTAGLVLFCVSLAVLVHGLLGGAKLVRKGPYRYIRHPQYLGLILIILPLALLYIPDCGIKLGDLVSWVQFVFLMVAFSDWEDFHLRKKFPDTFPEYYAKTGFLLPRISPSKGYGYFSIFRHPKARYALFIILYILVVIGLYLVNEFGPVTGYF